jgi:hypothetical protein
MYARMIMIIPGCITAVQADILRCEPEQKEKEKSNLSRIPGRSDLMHGSTKPTASRNAAWPGWLHCLSNTHL